MPPVPTRIAAAALVLALALLSAGPSAQQPAGPAHDLLMDQEQIRDLLQAIDRHDPYVPGELIVKFRDGVDRGAQARALSAIRGGVSGARTRWIGDVIVIGTPGEPDALLAARMLERQPEIEWAQPNYIRYKRAVPNDPQYSLQWNLDQIDMPRAWDINPGGSATVTIAVVDSGFTSTTETFPFRIWTGSQFETVPMAFSGHPDLAASRIVSGRDFVFWDGPVLDMDGHGSHVAGTALEETNNALGLAGVAYRARLLPLKVCVGYWELMILRASIGVTGFADPDGAGCPDSAMIQAIRFAADSGVPIINVSLGSPGEAPALLQALQYAVQRGSFITMPAGNSFLEGNPADYPAAYAVQVEGAVEVAATGRSRRRASYSTTGTHVELAAPGGDFADGGSNGLIYQIGPSFSDFTPLSVIRPRFDRYAIIGAAGTSSAAPHAAGVAALLYSQGITSPAAIEAALALSATDLGTTGRDNEFGHGLINARTALRGMGLAK